MAFSVAKRKDIVKYQVNNIKRSEQRDPPISRKVVLETASNDRSASDRDHSLINRFLLTTT